MGAVAIAHAIERRYGSFGPASVVAARAALDLLARPVSHEGAALRLVYVDRRAGAEPEPETAGSELISRLGVHAAFQQLVEQLDAPANVRHPDDRCRHTGRDPPQAASRDTAAGAAPSPSRVPPGVAPLVGGRRSERMIDPAITSAMMRSDAVIGTL